MLPQPLQHPFFCLPACLHWWWWWWFASLSRDEEIPIIHPNPLFLSAFSSTMLMLFLLRISRSFSTSRWFVTLIFLSSPIFLIVWYFDMRQKRFYSRLCSLCALAFPKKENFIIDSPLLLLLYFWRISLKGKNFCLKINLKSIGCSLESLSSNDWEMRHFCRTKAWKKLWKRSDNLRQVDKWTFSFSCGSKQLLRSQFDIRKKIREKLRTSIIAEWGYEDEIKLSE